MTRAAQPEVRCETNASTAESGRSVEYSERQLFEIVFRQMRTLAGAAATDLDDLVQAAAEQVLRSRSAFQGRSELATWIYAVCYRVLLNHRRWYRRWSLRFKVGYDETHAAWTSPSAPALLEERERIMSLRRAILRMSDKYRVVIVLHDLEGLPTSEIAAIVGASENTVRSRLRDGRKQLLRLLEIDPSFEQLGDVGELVPS